VFCLRCGSNRLRRSRTRGLKEKTLKLLGYRAFRCREENCDWRGMLKIRDTWENRLSFNPKLRVTLSIILWLLFFILSLVSYYLK